MGAVASTAPTTAADLAKSLESGKGTSKTRTRARARAHTHTSKTSQVSGIRLSARVLASCIMQGILLHASCCPSQNLFNLPALPCRHCMACTCVALRDVLCVCADTLPREVIRRYACRVRCTTRCAFKQPRLSHSHSLTLSLSLPPSLPPFLPPSLPPSLSDACSDSAAREDRHG